MKPYEVICATRGSSLTPTQRHVLTHVVMRAGADGECFASVPTLSNDTGFSDRAIQGALKDLVALGVLRPRTAKGRSTTYTVHGEAIPRTSCTPESGSPPNEVHPTPEPPAPLPPNEVHPTPEPPAPNSYQDSSLGLVPGRGKTRPLSRAPEEPTVHDHSATIRAGEFAELLRVWNTEIVPEVRKRGGTASEHARLTASKGIGQLVRQRLDQHGLDACMAVLRWYATAPKADFLRNEGYELDTLMKPQKFEKYLAKARASPSNVVALKPSRPWDPPRESAYTPDLDSMTPFERDIWLAANEEQR